MDECDLAECDLVDCGLAELGKLAGCKCRRPHKGTRVAYPIKHGVPASQFIELIASRAG